MQLAVFQLVILETCSQDPGQNVQSAGEGGAFCSRPRALEAPTYLSRVTGQFLLLECVTGGRAALSAFSLPGVTKQQCPLAKSTRCLEKRRTRRGLGRGLWPGWAALGWAGDSAPSFAAVSGSRVPALRRLKWTATPFPGSPARPAGEGGRCR